MRTSDIVRSDTGKRCGKFEVSVSLSDDTLKRVNSMSIDFKKYDTTVPSGMKIRDIVKLIAIKLFPDEDTDLFTFK